MEHFPIPIFTESNIYDSCEIKKPKSKLLADTLKIFNSKGVYYSLLTLISGSIDKISAIDGTSIDSVNQIYNLCAKMPYQTAEVISLKIMSLLNLDDVIEGVYECPRCKKVIVDDGNDKVSDLKIFYQGEKINGDFIDFDVDKYMDGFQIKLSEAIQIRNFRSQEILHNVVDLEIKFPTINDCIDGKNKYPLDEDESYCQNVIYLNSISKVNGDPVDKKFLNLWGKIIIDSLSYDDMVFIGSMMSKYGVSRFLEKTCSKCGRVWNAPANTSNFFVSGLRSV